MADKSQTRMRVARNFIKTYGRVRFHRLLTLLAQGISGQKIADEFIDPEAPNVTKVILIRFALYSMNI